MSILEEMELAVSILEPVINREFIKTKHGMKLATASDINDAAEAYAKVDSERGVTDPDGRFHAWRSIAGLWNSSSAEDSNRAQQEGPIAYRNFVNAYLHAQGWKRKRL